MINSLSRRENLFSLLSAPFVGGFYPLNVRTKNICLLLKDWAGWRKPKLSGSGKEPRYQCDRVIHFEEWQALFSAHQVHAGTARWTEARIQGWVLEVMVTCTESQHNSGQHKLGKKTKWHRQATRVPRSLTGEAPAALFLSSGNRIPHRDSTFLRLRHD